ncbi:low molecular weight protein-tyrosine-phosphatase [Alkalispirochaeta americana]|nr:low molecular weight protein-tyrosine-phosphatase [Alkalispirochaeta americana]
MFVCTGNICRSPLAQAILEKMALDRGVSEQIQVESSGTDGWHVGENADSRMRETAAAQGVNLNHRARQFSAGDLQEYDLVFAMGRNHLKAIREIARREGGSARAKVVLFREFDPALSGGGNPPDVPDPYYGGAEGFREVYRIVERTCDEILNEIQEERLP